jgi:DNA (cytosine-5)-methyltransferase 1
VMLTLSLFPGIGLLDRAFELEGFCVVRGPDCLWGGDIRTFHPPAGRFDGIIGGPPCQMFSSLANLVRANGYEPRFGNLIPEFERCVLEAQPSWFLMENVPAAPIPSVKGYTVKAFELDNAWLGEEQRRRRRFCFGQAGQAAADLRQWIEVAALELPRLSSALVGSLRKTPVAIGGSGKVKPHAQCGTVVGGDRTPHQRDALRAQTCTVTLSDGGKSVSMTRYRLADAYRLQGLPEDFLKDAPFTADGKLKAVANGVPIPMGRAMAQAINVAIGMELSPASEPGEEGG